MLVVDVRVKSLVQPVIRHRLEPARSEAMQSSRVDTTDEEESSLSGLHAKDGNRMRRTAKRNTPVAPARGSKRTHRKGGVAVPAKQARCGSQKDPKPSRLDTTSNGDSSDAHAAKDTDEKKMR